MKRKITRKEKRELLSDFNFASELIKIINHFFPDLLKQLSNVADPRNKSYITYKSEVILLTRILSSLFHIGSMRQLSVEFNNEQCIHNIKLLSEQDDLEELPHWQTINQYLEKLNPKELENIIQKMVERLIRMRCFEDSRIRNKYWQIVVDGTGIYSSDKRHCDHCLTKEHKDKDGNILWTEYYHYVLEAKLIVNGNIAISIATEFVENTETSPSKQDCELKAFYRLTENLKSKFKRLPICLTMDSLYACEPVMNLCNKYNWHYIIRFKDGSIPTVAKDFNALKDIEKTQVFNRTSDNVIETYKYVNDINYQENTINLVEYTNQTTKKKNVIVFLTDLPITKNNYESLVSDGRRRWKIENEGFNRQKNHGYFIEHMFSQNYNAIKNHYFLIQIASMLSQLFENGVKLLKQLKMSLKEIHSNLKSSFKTTLLNKDFRESKENFQVRFT